MFKKVLVVATLLVAGNAQAALTSAGDIAFTAFNADEDGLSFVTFVDISANTQIFFADNEWNGSAVGAGGAFNSGENYMQWVSGANLISAGSVVRFSEFNMPTASASLGTLSRLSITGNTNYGIGNSGETIYAYLGTSATAPTSFLAAITNSSFSTADGTLTNTGLTVGVNAMRLRTSGSPDFGQYNGVRSGLTSFAAYKTLVNDVTNWTVDTTDGDYTTTVPNTTAFTVAAVPEPETYGMLLAGLGFIGFVARRKTTV